MIVGAIVLTISFILDGLLSSFLPFTLHDIWYLKPMLTITSIVLIYPYFNNEKSKFYRLVIIFGFLYDIVYANSFPLNTFIFFLLAITVQLLNSFLSNNNINVMIMTILTIAAFELFNFILLNIIDYISISFNEMLYKIVNSLLINVFYSFIGYAFLNYISDRYNIKRIN
jgi:rod shape-determining protein MreD